MVLHTLVMNSENMIWLNVMLKEYSVILKISFYDINQKIVKINGYFQNFS